MKFVRFCIAIALLATSGCGGGPSESNLEQACNANEDALRKSRARILGADRAALSQSQLAQQRECCKRMAADSSRLSGPVKKYLMKNFEFVVLRSAGKDQQEIDRNRDALDKTYRGLSEKDRQLVQQTSLTLLRCSAAAARNR